MISILEGKVERVLPVQNGVSKAGKAWEKHSYVIETSEKYPKKVQVETLKPLVFSVGEFVRLGVEIESREWHERWYHTITIIGKVDENNKLIPTESPAQVAPAQEPAQTEEQRLLADAAAADFSNGTDNKEDQTNLPF